LAPWWFRWLVWRESSHRSTLFKMGWWKVAKVASSGSRTLGQLGGFQIPPGRRRWPAIIMLGSVVLAALACMIYVWLLLAVAD
jgi:hypothetical protein